MTCPHCHHAFELTWPRYFELQRRRRLRCPNCLARSKCDFSPAAIGIAGPAISICMMLTVFVVNHWLSFPACLVGILPVILLLFPLGKFVDGRWGILHATGEKEATDVAHCAECKSEFPIEEMITHNGVYCCSRCKPIFLQKLSEGMRLGAPAGRRHPLRTWQVWFWVLFACLLAALTRIYFLR